MARGQGYYRFSRRAQVQMRLQQFPHQLPPHGFQQNEPVPAARLEQIRVSMQKLLLSDESDRRDGDTAQYVSLFLNEYNAFTDSTRFVLFLNHYNYSLICIIVPQ